MMTADDYFDEGNRCELDEDFQGAIAYYTEAIRLQPHFPEAYFNRAGDHELVGEYANAIADYEVAIQQMPDDPTAYVALATIYLDEDYPQFLDPKLATKNAYRACELTHFQDYGALATLAKACAASGRLRDAVRHQQRAIQIVRGEVQVHPEHAPRVDAEIWLDEFESNLSDYQCEQRNQSWFQRLLSMIHRE